MQVRADVLKKQLLDLQQFETLFASNDLAEFDKSLNDNDTGFKKYMGENEAEITTQVFSDFTFQKGDARHQPSKEAFKHLGALVGTQQASAMLVGSKSYNFFQSSITEIRAYFKTLGDNQAAEQAKSRQNYFQYAATLTSDIVFDLVDGTTEKQSERLKLLKCIRDLIAFQKLHLQQELAVSLENEKLAQSNDPQPISRSALIKKYAFHTGMTTLGAAGVGIATFSALMQFNPHFAMLVGLHFTPAVLASVAAAGVVVAVAAAYVVYRAVRPSAQANNPTEVAQPVTSAGYSKLLTTAILSSGFGFAAFTALVQFSPMLMQFSPKFALLVGLNLSPAALIGIAAVGVLMLSIGLYRMCKARAQTPANDTTTEVKDAAPTVTLKDRFNQCVNSISQYTPSCCFRLFRRGDAGTAGATQVNDITNTDGITAKV